MILALATPLIGSRRWFPHGVIGTTLIAIGGAAIPTVLWLAKIPPKWFSGSAWGFTLALTLMASGFGFRTADEKFYRLPFLFSFGAALLVFNVWAHV